MKILSMTENDRSKRRAIMKHADELKDKGVCPTCQNFQTFDVYPSIEEQIFHEDSHVICFLETYPRNPGHTIVLLKHHYEDISSLPPESNAQVFSVIHKVVAAIKKVLEAEKVYMCTMCDGKRNHLHFQLIPRYKEDNVRGSKLFVKDRQVLIACKDIRDRLVVEMERKS